MNESQPPLYSVLNITRDYFTLDGKLADHNNLSSGQLLVVGLKVSASKRVSDALVVDLLQQAWSWKTRTSATVVPASATAQMR